MLGYYGKKNAEAALRLFNKEQDAVGLSVDVKRHPYSFLGHRQGEGSLPGAEVREGSEPSWHDCGSESRPRA